MPDASQAPRRIVVVVIDSFGIGALPDAAGYGDAGADTAGSAALARPGGPAWPNLLRLGLAKAGGLTGSRVATVDSPDTPEAAWGVMAGASPGKDTTTGHWELAGLILDQPLHIFPSQEPSFPPELLEPLGEQYGCGFLGNCGASGTEIINRLGADHLKSGDPIVYTSADSVFQVAAHEAVWPVENLYAFCRDARKRCDALRVGRVIARPFEGEPGAFTRTPRRKDFSMALPGETLLDRLSAAGVNTIGVGKIGDIFNGRGLKTSHPDKGNPACLERLDDLLAQPAAGPEFVFVNLVDTDMVYGHRRDPQGYQDAVSAIDGRIPGWLAALEPQDRLVLTADHGCDPGWRGSDHTREYVPLLVAGPGVAPVELGTRATFADLAAAVGQVFGLPASGPGTAFEL
ncbi:MAG: phosphopentomutase [Opitutales bacterium]